jgi:WD40 repeat protein/serine/threonine protein kinase
MAMGSGEVLVGRVLGGFVLVEKIAEGGFGDVYRAEQSALGRAAVVKLLKARHRGAEHIVERFEREAQLAARLDHPFAAHIYAHGAEPDGLLWIAMEYVRGATLAHIIAAQGRLKPERVVALLDRVAEVVQSAHEAGIVHRDLKPANVMVLLRAGRLVPKLLDFGIAKVVEATQPMRHVPFAPVPAPAPVAEARPAPVADTMAVVTGPVGHDTAPLHSTRSGTLLGSPPYMAPELWAGEEADSRSDQYALAILTFEALAGRLPFEQQTMQALAAAHLTEPLPPLGSDLPAALDAVLARAAAKRPDDRYPDVISFVAAVRAAAGVSGDNDDVPRLPPVVHDRLATRLPAPLAEAVQALGGSRSVRAARDALHVATRAVLRFVAALALVGRDADAPVSERARALVPLLFRRELEDGEALELARELGADARAVPELACLREGAGTWLAALLELARAGRNAAGDDGVREELERALPLLAAVLGQLDWLTRAELVVTRGDLGELWRGGQRTHVARPPAADEGQPALLREGAPPLLLWPLVQAAAPILGARDDLFLLAGGSHGDALLCALPGGFERRDASARAWLAARFPDAATADEPSGEAPERPYLGLASFTAGDAHLYLGREREIEECKNRVRAESLLVVVGPSGVGKSSFVQAGLAPALPYRALVVRPGATPLATLAARLAATLGHADATVLAGQLAHDPSSVQAFLASATGPPLLLVVDQLEELFTLGASPAVRAAFAETLAAAADLGGAVRVVATLRDDFLTRAGALPGLGPRLPHALFLLGTPDEAELLRIVTEPARRAGYRFDDPHLPADMVADVVGRPGALALLSFTAARLWDDRDPEERVLRHASYAALGGVAGALGQHAEATLAAMPEEQRLKVREAFRHLVTREGTRARLPRAELSERLGGGAAVIDALVGARLLSTTLDDEVELAHEALLAAWPRALAWRREDDEGAALRVEVRDLARRWDGRGRAAELLIGGDELAELERWRARHTPKLTEVEAAFLDASVRARQRGRNWRRGLAAAALVAASGLAVTYSALYQRARQQTVLAEERLGEVAARRDELLLLQARSAVDRDPTAALAWLKVYARSGQSWPEVQAIAVDAWSRGAARLVLRGHESAVFQLAFSPDGKRLASASFDKTVRVWTLGDSAPPRVLAGHEGELNAVAFTPDGGTVLSASDDGTVRVWDLATGASRVLRGHRGTVTALAAFAHARRLVSGGTDGTVRLWELDADSGEPRILVNGSAGSIQKLALAPDDATVATVGEGADVWLWPVAGGAPRRLHGHERRVSAVAWAADGRTLASADVEGNLLLWDVASGASRPLGAHRGMVRTLAFTRDGARLVSGGYDEAVNVWDVDGGRRTLRGHQGPVYGVALSPDGTCLASGGLDGRIRVWDLPAGGQVFRDFHAGPGDSVAFAPDGESLAYTAGPALRVGRLADGTLLDLPGGTAGQKSLAFSPDGRHVAAVDEGGTVRAWSLPDGGAASTEGATGPSVNVAFALAGDVVYFPAGKAVVGWHLADGRRQVFVGPGDAVRRVVAGPGGSVFALAGDELWAWEGDAPGRRLGTGESWMGSLEVSPDGRTLATGDHSNAVELWDRERGLGFVLRGHEATVDPLAFSADGRLLVSGGYDRTVRVWDLASRSARVFNGHRTIVRRVALAPDGSYAVSTGNDDFVRTWDLLDGSAGAFVAHDGAVQAMALAADGRRLASGGADGTVRLWDPGRRDHVPASAEALRAWLEHATSATTDDVR